MNSLCFPRQPSQGVCGKTDHLRPPRGPALAPALDRESPVGQRSSVPNWSSRRASAVGIGPENRRPSNKRGARSAYAAAQPSTSTPCAGLGSHTRGCNRGAEIRGKTGHLLATLPRSPGSAFQLAPEEAPRERTEEAALGSAAAQPLAWLL